MKFDTWMRVYLLAVITLLLAIISDGFLMVHEEREDYKEFKTWRNWRHATPPQFTKEYNKMHGKPSEDNAFGVEVHLIGER